MAVGVVRSFHEDKGYGFIETDEGEQFFVHHSAIEMEGFRTLSRGDRVLFEVTVTRRGHEAAHVRKL
jgi:cold shock protein